MKYISTKVPRVFDKYKVTGESKYIHDIELPNMLYLYIVRSSVPHGVIKRIDYSKLASRDFIKFIFSGKDVKLGNIGILKDQPPLKYPKVRSVGDEILAIVTTDLDKTRKYVESDLELVIDELPAVFDPIEALKPNAPLVHEELGTNIVNLNFNVTAGDIEKALNESYMVLEEEYMVPRVSHSPMGTLGAIAYVDNNGLLNLISNTQEPYQLKKELSESLGLDARKIKIIQPDIGGTFGRGMDIYPFEVIASYAALRVKKPIKIENERNEHL
ncbi:MAG: molybdopterin cofactor-binding domain-containing protein [Sulfolobaceae archaeon]